jgi:hypothetical protein
LASGSIARIVVVYKDSKKPPKPCYVSVRVSGPGARGGQRM